MPSATPRLSDLEGPSIAAGSPFKKQRASFAGVEGLNITGLAPESLPQSLLANVVDPTRENAKTAASAALMSSGPGPEHFTQEVVEEDL